MASAAILIGGQARRFGGADKGGLAIGGRTIRERQIHELELLSDDILLVGDQATDAPAHVRLVGDRTPNSGPLGGLDATLAAARDDQVILVACDMPFLAAPFLAHLLVLAADPHVDAVVPRTKRGYHPLCAVYTRACHPHVTRRLATGRMKMLELLEEIRVRVVERTEIERFGESDRLLANVNTPDELRDLEALLTHKL